MVYLLHNRDRIFSRQERPDTLREGKVVTESALSNCIKAARHAVGDNGHSLQHIATFHRRGYRFGGPVADEKILRDSALANDEAAWIAEVMGEDIGMLLARIPGFLVLSRNTTSQYRGREPGADYVVEGSAWTIDGKLRAAVRLPESARPEPARKSGVTFQGTRCADPIQIPPVPVAGPCV